MEKVGGFLSRKDSVMKEWDEASESWADFVRNGKDYYKDELNNPATFRLVGARGKCFLVYSPSLTSESISGTSIKGPMTAANAAPEPIPIRVVATAMATSK